MENASNALIIAGTVLIALIIISLGIYLAISNSKIQEAYIKNLTTQEIDKFNSKFLAFNNRDNITAQEIVTLMEYAKQFDANHGTTTVVKLNTGEIGDTKVFLKNSLPEYNGTTIKYTYYKCNYGTLNDIQYDSNGIIKSIKFTKHIKSVGIDI